MGQYEFEFKGGDRAEYYDRSRRTWVPVTVIGTGYEAGDPVYDVRLDYDGSEKWGWAEQVRAPQGAPTAL